MFVPKLPGYFLKVLAIPMGKGGRVFSQHSPTATMGYVGVVFID